MCPRRRLPWHRGRLFHRHVFTTLPLPYTLLSSQTNTFRKTNTKNVLGTSGLRHILTSLSTSPYASTVKTVCIGGVNDQNIQRIIYQSAAEVAGSADCLRLDGAAVVSAIIGAEDPEIEAWKLVQLVETPPAFVARGAGARSQAEDVEGILAQAKDVISAVNSKTPLSHNMTNLVRISHTNA